MDLLVLGGGGFLGFHIAAEAFTSGHRVTTFNRDGHSVIPGVEALKGDREDDLSALTNRRWDAVIDTFSDPDAVRQTAQLLSPSVTAYGYVSGISVYHPEGPDVVDEHAPLRNEDDALGADPLQERSLLKLACEVALREHFKGSLLIARVGIMVGPRDPTDRFSWWPKRFQQALTEGAPVLTPGDPARPVQFTDARDLASWLVRSVSPMREGGPLTGTFNAVGPGRTETLSHVLDTCLEAARDELGSASVVSPELVWAGEDFLRERLAAVAEEARPLWFPEDQIPFKQVDSAKALEAGLTFRPSYETARDTLRWLKAHSHESKSGFAPENEAKLIDEWKRVAR
jgi:2'-hydroxyisoflavone reductase